MVAKAKNLAAIVAFLGLTAFGNVSPVQAQQDQTATIFRTRCVLDTATVAGRRHLDGSNRAERAVISVTRDGKVRVNGNPVETSVAGENPSGEWVAVVPASQVLWAMSSHKLSGSVPLINPTEDEQKGWEFIQRFARGAIAGGLPGNPKGAAPDRYMAIILAEPGRQGGFSAVRFFSGDPRVGEIGGVAEPDCFEF